MLTNLRRLTTTKSLAPLTTLHKYYTTKSKPLMFYNQLGNSGLKVSALSFGAWLTTEEKYYDLMVEAFNNGCNFFDNAENYGSGQNEIIMGKALKKAGWRRSQYVVSTKLFFGIHNDPNETGLSRKHLRDGLHDSLKRLDMDYVDLLFCHRPDPTVPMEEIVWTMNHFIQRGLVLYWGTSEWSRDQLEEAFQVAERLKLIPPTMEQPEYNMFRREKVEREFKPLYEKYGLGLTVWSPLASGVLTGKYVNEIPEESRLGTKSGLDPKYQNRMKRLRDELLSTEIGKKKLEKVKKLMKIADELDCTMSQLALAWCMKNKHVSSVITGASSVEQVRENFRAVDVVGQLNDDVMENIDDILKS